MKLDFLPERIIRKRNDVRRRLIFAYIVVITCAVLTGIWRFNSVRVERTGDDLAQLDCELQNMDRQLEELAELEKKISGLKLKQRIDNNLGSCVNALDILKELGDILPENMALTDVRIETQPVSLKFKVAKATHTTRAKTPKEQKKINRVKLVLTGISNDNVSVANFIADLSASSLFEDVNMGYSKIIAFKGKEAKEFQANCYVMR